MKVGTKSLLFGYHNFLVHPLFVWVAWVKLYGWTWDPRIVAAFFLHDLGYWGKPNMDGIEGKQHPFFGAKAMHFLFDWPCVDCELRKAHAAGDCRDYARWYKFSLYHSRTMCKLYFADLSSLGYADKLAFNLYPDWLIMLLGNASGENQEYVGAEGSPRDPKEWLHQAKVANLKTLEELRWR